MSKKQHGGPGPIPKGNQSQMGPNFNEEPVEEQAASEGTSEHEQDAKRRLGNFVGAGEQSVKQPGGKNDANH
jgi:hypothetical protein